MYTISVSDEIQEGEGEDRRDQCLCLSELTPACWSLSLSRDTTPCLYPRQRNGSWGYVFHQAEDKVEFCATQLLLWLK